MSIEAKVSQLESKVRRLERQVEELIRQLKRVDSDAIKHAARRAGNA